MDRIQSNPHFGKIIVAIKMSVSPINIVQLITYKCALMLRNNNYIFLNANQIEFEYVPVLYFLL